MRKKRNINADRNALVDMKQSNNNLMIEETKMINFGMPIWLDKKWNCMHTWKPFIDYSKAFVWIIPKCGKFFKRWEYQITLLATCETCMQVKKEQLDLDVEQKTDSKLGKECVKVVYCHPACLSYPQSTSWEMLGWMKHKLESRLSEEISNNLRYADDTTLTAKIKEELKSLLMTVKEDSENAALILNIKKN